MRFLLLLTLPLYLADQATKWAILATIPPEQTVPVIPGVFNLVQVHNTGAAFGMFKDNNAFFVVLSIAALGAMAWFARRGAFCDTPSRVAAALLASGVLGNLTDRLLHGHVIDFLDVILPWYGHWPAFNIADSAISAAAVLFLLASFTAPAKS